MTNVDPSELAAMRPQVLVAGCWAIFQFGAPIFVSHR